MSESRLLPAVLSDIAMAAQWYDDQGYPGLGDRFVDVFISTYAIYSNTVEPTRESTPNFTASY